MTLGSSLHESDGRDTDSALWDALGSVESADAFCRKWLAFQCQGVPSVATALLVLGGADGARSVEAAHWPEATASDSELAKVAERGIQQGETLVLRSRSTSPGIDGPVFVSFPLRVGGATQGAVALRLSEGDNDQVQRTLRQLNWGIAWLEGLLTRSDSAANPAPADETTDPGTRAEVAPKQRSILELMATVIQHERFESAALAFVTELATRFDCDRVSLGARKRRRMQLVAMSHTAKIGKTNLVRAIETAMDESCDQRSVVSVPQVVSEQQARFSISRDHEELARQHGSGAILSLPLVTGEDVAAVVTFERSGDKPFDPATQEYCEALWALVGPYLDLKRRESRILALKALDSADDQLRKLIGPRHMGRKIAAVSITLVTLFLLFAHGDYRVSSRTLLEGSVQRVAVAPFDGYLKESNVRPGDIVREGDVLCSFRVEDLQLEKVTYSSERERLSKQYRQALAGHDPTTAKIARALMNKAQAQIDLADEHLNRASVQAPFDGVIVSGDLDESIGAPVGRGDPLFQIAPLDGYRVILEVDERDIAEVALEQRGHLVLSAFPSEHFPFTVKRITPVSTAAEGRNYFRVEAELDPTEHALRPGLEGVGKIEIESRHLTWIWTHEALDWMRLKLWAWLP